MGTGSVTLWIIILIVATSFYAWNKPAVYQQFLMNPYMVFRRNQYWRMLTSGFIHSGYVHLGFNMFTFYFFGTLAEQVFIFRLGETTGTLVYIFFFISGIILSDLTVAWRNRDNMAYNSLGASGAVSAMVFSSILYFPLQPICLFGLICLPGFILGALYVIYSYTQGKNMSDNINHEAHLYGAVYGVLFSLLVYPSAGMEFFQQLSQYRLF